MHSRLTRADTPTSDFVTCSPRNLVSPQHVNNWIGQETVTILRPTELNAEAHLRLRALSKRAEWNSSLGKEGLPERNQRGKERAARPQNELHRGG